MRKVISIIVKILLIALFVFAIISSVTLLSDMGTALDESWSYSAYFHKNIWYVWGAALGFPLSGLLSIILSFIKSK